MNDFNLDRMVYRYRSPINDLVIEIHFLLTGDGWLCLIYEEGDIVHGAPFRSGCPDAASADQCLLDYLRSA